MTATAGSDVVQSGRPIFDDFFQHLWPYIGNNTANVVFQMVKHCDFRARRIRPCVDDEMDEDEDNNEINKVTSNADSFSALETAMERYEQQSECCPAQLLLLKRIRDLSAKK
ncbi:hypothetical protein TNCV_1110111 [Trichonephila clavipes]|nr:hypothetical protein TNCV_1110111 [Trichonephila clavipes]